MTEFFLLLLAESLGTPSRLTASAPQAGHAVVKAAAVSSHTPARLA